MKQRMVSFGDDFWIENSSGQKVFKADGKMVRVRDTLFFEDAHGKELCKIQTKVARVKDSMTIVDPNGKRMAMVKKALITPLRERWVVNVGDGPDLEVQGNILDHEYSIGEGRDKVAEVSKKWFRFRDSYGVQWSPARMTSSFWPRRCHRHDGAPGQVAQRSSVSSSLLRHDGAGVQRTQQAARR